jgi:hypothetical protein
MCTLANVALNEREVRDLDIAASLALGTILRPITLLDEGSALVPCRATGNWWITPVPAADHGLVANLRSTNDLGPGRCYSVTCAIDRRVWFYRHVD